MAAILKRVAELQANQSNSAHQTGLTLKELEAAAVDAGLDPSLLHRAAADIELDRSLDQPKKSDSNATHIFENRWINGEVEEEAWEDLVFELKHRFDSDTGKALGMPSYGLSTTESIGRSREWKHTSMSGVETRVLVRSRDGSSRISLSQRVGIASKITESIMYGSILTIFVTLIAAAASESFLVTTLVTLATLMTVVPLIYIADKAWRNRKHAELQKLADTTVGILGATRRTSAAPVVESSPTAWSTSATNNILEDVDTFGKDAESPIDKETVRSASGRESES